MGRTKNNNFEELQFQLIKNGTKYNAYCGVCNKTLANTASIRLKAHRRICKTHHPDSSNANETDEDASLIKAAENSETRICNESKTPALNSYRKMRDPTASSVSLSMKQNINKRSKIKGTTSRDAKTEILVKSYDGDVPNHPNKSTYRNLNSYRKKYAYSQNTIDMDEEEAQQSSDDASSYMTTIKSAQYKRRTCARRQDYISTNDNDDYKDDPRSITNSKRPRLIIREKANNDTSQLNLVQFVSEQLDKQRDHISEQLDKQRVHVNDQLEKQREHQKEITKTFTDAMAAQFTQFTNLIANFMQQMYNTQTNQRQQTHRQSDTETFVKAFENGA